MRRKGAEVPPADGKNHSVQFVQCHSKCIKVDLKIQPAADQSKQNT